MELIVCSECQGFSSPGSKLCQQCGAAIKEEAPPVPSIPAAAPPAEEEPAPQEATDEGPSVPAFDGPPEIMAKLGALETAIAKDPSSKTPYLQLSQAYAEAKRLDLAAAVLERFLEVDPNNAYVRHRLAQIAAKRDGTAPAAAEQPAAQPVPGAAAAAGPVAAPRKTPGTLPPRQAISQVALAQRPAAPVIKREFQTWTSRQKTMIAAGLGVAALLFIVKVYVFPGTRRLVGGEFRAYAPAFSPTGNHVAFLIADGQSTRLAVYDMRQGKHRPLATISEGGFSWSPDGNRLAYTASGGGDDWRGSVFVVDIATGQASKVAAGSTPVWSGSSTLIMLCSPEPPRAVSEDEPGSFAETDWAQRYCRADVATGTVQRTRVAADFGMAVSGSVDAVVYEQVKQDESTAASVAPPNKDFEQMVDRVTAGRARNVAEGSRDLNRELEAKKYEERRRALTQNQRLPYEADVVVASLDGGSPTLLTSGGQSAFPSWTADGRVLYATNGAAGIEIWSMTAQGSDKRAMLRGVKLADPKAVQVTRDGRYVFFVAPVEGDPGLARTMTGEDPADIHIAPAGGNKASRLANQHPFKQRFTVSPDGKLVAYEVLQDIKLLGGAQRSEIWLTRR